MGRAAVAAEPLYAATMRPRKKIALGVGGLFVGLVLLILINSSLGVDREETFTDLHRPQIVGDQANFE